MPTEISSRHSALKRMYPHHYHLTQLITPCSEAEVRVNFAKLLKLLYKYNLITLNQQAEFQQNFESVNQSNINDLTHELICIHDICFNAFCTHLEIRDQNAKTMYFAKLFVHFIIKHELALDATMSDAHRELALANLVITESKWRINEYHSNLPCVAYFVAAAGLFLLLSSSIPLVLGFVNANDKLKILGCVEVFLGFMIFAGGFIPWVPLYQLLQAKFSHAAADKRLDDLSNAKNELIGLKTWMYTAPLTASVIIPVQTMSVSSEFSAPITEDIVHRMSPVHNV